MKVIVCGGRHYADAGQLFHILDRLGADLGIVTLIHGDARGADRLGGSWGRARGKEVIAVPAEWERYGKAAGHLRNQRMLDMEPDAVIAFPGGRSRHGGHDTRPSSSSCEPEEIMSAQPTHDLAVNVGEYTDRQTGEQKARWQRIGTVFRHDDGGTSINLDCLPISAEWAGWVSVFKREPKDENTPPRQPQHRNEGRGGFQQPVDFDDDIPF